MRTSQSRKASRQIKNRSVSLNVTTSGLEIQIEDLKSLIKHPPSTSKIIEFSPALAEHILTNFSRDNRPTKPAKIKRYAQDIVDGRWGLTGDTIKFGSNGVLRDGQNRLAACVRAGRSIRSHVVFGIDPDLFTRMDIGKNRTPADVFSIAGIPYASHVAGAVRWLVILTGPNPGDRGAQFSNEELLQAYREKFDADKLEHSIQCALAVRKSTRHPVAPLAALHYIFAEKNREKADGFYEEWVMDRTKRARAPTRYLQRRLVEVARQSNQRLHENVRNALIIKAWNAYVAGRALTKAEMQHAPGDKMPKISG
ncbi:hypothetical protein [Bradyrhizobium sp. dw_411]|uniref:hypothetical protein n=1 Tax=Bradyrhizobium sp. dw_411 TaxID=2720082 RepID=UPI001BCC4395|nr:hypothetical protein [Bradyrhizobium sp. dw_411]